MAYPTSFPAVDGRKRRTPLARAIVALALATAVLGHATATDALVGDLCYLAALVGAAAGAWIGAERREAGAGRAIPRLVAAGLTLTALGDVLWTVVNRTGGDTDVSIADPAWLLSYGFLGAAIWAGLLRSRPGRRIDVGFVVDGITIVAVCLLVFWRIAIAAILSDSGVDPLVRAAWAAYPLLDAVLLGMVARVLLSPRARVDLDLRFVLGVLLWLGADCGYLFLDNHDASLVLDGAWMLAPALMATAAWRTPPPTTGRPAVRSQSRWVAQLCVAVCPLVVPPAIDLWSDVRDDPDHPVELFVGTAVLLVLALVRTGRLLRSEERTQRELAQARDAALAASEAKTMFLANMSHELRTPLTTILAVSELLEDSPLTDGQHALVSRTQRAGRRLTALVESLLDFSRVEAGQVDLQSVPFDLVEVIDDIVEAHLPRADTQGVELDQRFAADLPRAVVGDPLRVAQVIGNLVDNAVKFTERGRVLVAASHGDTPGTVRIAVSDTGIGIRAEDQAAVFASFTQVDGSATRRYEGSGLGLAICKELTELMGGRIALSSEPGVGSTFEVVLPLGAPQPTSARQA